MESLNSISLINKNYEKILDIVSKEFKNIEDVKKNCEKVDKLLWETINEDKNICSKILSSYNFIWNNMPKEIFEVKTIDKLNENIYKFALYVDEVSNEYTDYGFSLFVAFYLKVCKDFLSNCI